MEKLNKYDSEYPKKNSPIKIYKPKNSYPVIEKTFNAELFPEGPKDDIDMNDFK